MVAGRGYTDAGDFATGSSAVIGLKAAEAYTTSARGAYFVVETTPIGSTTRAEALRITDAGLLTFQGITSGHPAIKRNGAALDFRLADDSGYCDISAKGLNLSSSIQLGEAPILLDASLSADGTYSGIAEAGTAGATLAFGDLVYLSASDSRWELADADAEASAGPVKLGICVLAAAGDGSATIILLQGKVRADSNFPTLTIGAPVYISTDTGDITTTQPNGTDDVVRIVGYGNTADELYFSPSQNWIVHA
jgi:hypothetical protein